MAKKTTVVKKKSAESKKVTPKSPTSKSKSTPAIQKIQNPNQIFFRFKLSGYDGIPLEAIRVLARLGRGNSNNNPNGNFSQVIADEIFQNPLGSIGNGVEEFNVLVKVIVDQPGNDSLESNIFRHTISRQEYLANNLIRISNVDAVSFKQAKLNLSTQKIALATKLSIIITSEYPFVKKKTVKKSVKK